MTDVEDVISAIFGIFIVAMLIGALGPELSKISPYSVILFTIGGILIILSIIASLLKK